MGRNGIVPAMATPDARICRRVRSVGFSFSLIAACPFRGDQPATSIYNSIRCLFGDAAFCALLPEMPVDLPGSLFIRQRKIMWWADDLRPDPCPEHGVRHGMGNPVAARSRLCALRR